MKDTYKITNVHPPIDQKDVVNKEYCDNNLLSSNNKTDILSKNITELRKKLNHHLQPTEILYGLMVIQLN